MSRAGSTDSTETRSAVALVLSEDKCDGIQSLLSRWRRACPRSTFSDQMAYAVAAAGGITAQALCKWLATLIVAVPTGLGDKTFDFLNGKAPSREWRLPCPNLHRRYANRVHSLVERTGFEPAWDCFGGRLVA